MSDTNADTRRTLPEMTEIHLELSRDRVELNRLRDLTADLSDRIDALVRCGCRSAQTDPQPGHDIPTQTTYPDPLTAIAQLAKQLHLSVSVSFYPPDDNHQSGDAADPDPTAYHPAHSKADRCDVPCCDNDWK